MTLPIYIDSRQTAEQKIVSVSDVKQQRDYLHDIAAYLISYREDIPRFYSPPLPTPRGDNARHVNYN
jgi:hypothetical protein